MKIIHPGETREATRRVAECARCHSLMELDEAEYDEAVRSATYCANCGWHITVDDVREVRD